MMQRCRSKIRILLLCVLALSLFASQAFAASLEENGKLTIQSRCAGEAVPGMTYSLYRVADVGGGPKYIPTTSYPVDLSAETADAWDGVAKALTGYVQMDAVEPSYTAVAGEDGDVTLDVERGLYLVVGQTQKIGSYTYKVRPGLVSVPNMIDGAWNYDVTMNPKLERDDIPDHPPTKPTQETVDRKALKVWEDEGFEEQRPAEITVHLIRNGEVFRTESLSAANGWSCEWRGLDAKDADGAEYEWLVAESPLEDYTVTVEQSGVTFVITNTYLEEVPEDPVPLGPAEPGNPGGPDEPLEELPEDPVPLAMLPQTGVLWWPVPVFLCLGIAFLILGTSVRKKGAI